MCLFGRRSVVPSETVLFEAQPTSPSSITVNKPMIFMRWLDLQPKCSSGQVQVYDGNELRSGNGPAAFRSDPEFVWRNRHLPPSWDRIPTPGLVHDALTSHRSI